MNIFKNTECPECQPLDCGGEHGSDPESGGESGSLLGLELESVGGKEEKGDC